MRDLDHLKWAADTGFGVFEVCVSDPGAIEPDALETVARQTGVRLTVSGDFGPSRDTGHPDGHVRDNAVAYMRECIDIAVALGSPIFAGPLYSAVGKARWLSTEERAAERSRSVESLRKVAEYAAEQNVRLALEPLNRFETDMVNTVRGALDLLDAIDVPGTGLMLDTFHMNIEEKDQADAIRTAGDAIAHFQASENDRGTPGTGAVPWHSVRDALSDTGYGGDIVIESFVPVPALADGASIWRDPADSMRRLASEGLTYLTGLFS
ncbi:sugar phosphate isomerase/epimerase family protein [Amycolatopsis sp. CA-161197]|uniref:sugar phosphate isomerase/epimerase family protein n=1 Tax=Amycolatopsis sp. CA-161197 TaxID=3239922 RepID=UPI003D930FCF